MPYTFFKKEEKYGTKDPLITECRVSNGLPAPSWSKRSCCANDFSMDRGASRSVFKKISRAVSASWKETSRERSSSPPSAEAEDCPSASSVAAWGRYESKSTGLFSLMNKNSLDRFSVVASASSNTDPATSNKGGQIRSKC